MNTFSKSADLIATAISDVETQGVMEVPLDQVLFHSPAHIEIAGLTDKIEGKVIKSFFKSLHLDGKFNEYYDKAFGREDWAALISRLRDKSESPVFHARLENDVVTHIRVKRDGGVQNSKFLEMLLDLDKDFHFDLKYFSVNPQTGIFSGELLIPESHKEIILGDLWNHGISFFNDPGAIEHTKVLTLLNRLVCTNGATVPIRKGVIYAGKDQPSMIDYRKIIHNAISRFSIEQSLVEPLHILKNANASIGELLYYTRLLEQLQDGVFDPLIQTLIRYDYLSELYGVASLDQSKRWKSTADSGYNAYDLLNLLTWVGSHDRIHCGGHDISYTLTESEKMQLQITAGKLLFRTPDLIDVARKSAEFDPKYQLNLAMLN